VEVSMIEIYNEKIKDLLNPTDKDLKVTERAGVGVWVEGLSLMPVATFGTSCYHSYYHSTTGY
jgi:hypothetical protein